MRGDGTYRQLKSGKWNCVLRPKGQKAISITRRLKSEVEAAVREVQASLNASTHVALGDTRKLTVGALLRRYREEVGDRKASWRSLSNRIDRWLREPWASAPVTDKGLPLAIQEYRDRRLKEVKAATVRLELCRMSAAFNHAIKEWHLPLNNPVARIKRPPVTNRSRTKVWTDEQVQAALDYFKFDPERPPVSTADFMGWTILLLRRTGLRLGTLCKMKIAMLRPDAPVLDLPGKILKNREDFECPLDGEAEALLRKLAEYRKGHDRFIQPDASNMSATWTNTRRAGHPFLVAHPDMAGLRLHDLRHTWTTEKAPGVRDPMTLCKITGRKDLKEMLAYYNPDAVKLAAMLNTKKPDPAAAPADVASILAQMAALQEALMKATSGGVKAIG